jgi:hypothetical protein
MTGAGPAGTVWCTEAWVSFCPSTGYMEKRPGTMGVEQHRLEIERLEPPGVVAALVQGLLEALRARGVERASRPVASARFVCALGARLLANDELFNAPLVRLWQLRHRPCRRVRSRAHLRYMCKRPFAAVSPCGRKARELRARRGFLGASGRYRARPNRTSAPDLFNDCGAAEGQPTLPCMRAAYLAGSLKRKSAQQTATH